ncbi:cell wall [Pyrenophora seminiperda CCB06]|uniref:Cell wall n=1 Tax=Pyrenophora seminiperda CCB06 TaxID=1302712 RepID=A0A3M7M4A6_9PLEO|nr:cell wall [Pyrenophora seminiperda CCB06]
MKFTTTAALASTLALASAAACPKPDAAAQSAPYPSTPDAVNIFRLNALITTGPYQQNATIQAYKGGLGINVKQNASCADANSNYISLFVDKTNGNLGVYSDYPPITAYVDRSGMGQGLLRFSTGVAPPLPKNAERGPWKITKDLDLVFAPTNGENGLQACTSDGGKTFSVWLRGVNPAGGYKECYPFVGQVLPVPENLLNKCAYNDFGTN